MSSAKRNKRSGIGVLERPGIHVFIGGALGALTRAALDWLNQGANFFGVAYSTITVNVLGAFFMGLLFAVWGLRRSGHAWWDKFKLFAGTGFLGAFTTYSSFALMVAHASVYDQRAWIAAALVVLIGMFAAFAGVTVGRWLGAQK